MVQDGKHLDHCRSLEHDSPVPAVVAGTFTNGSGEKERTQYCMKCWVLISGLSEWFQADAEYGDPPTVQEYLASLESTDEP